MVSALLLGLHLLILTYLEKVYHLQQSAGILALIELSNLRSVRLSMG